MSKDRRTPGQRRETIGRTKTQQPNNDSKKAVGQPKEARRLFYFAMKEVTTMAGGSISIQIENLRQLMADVEAIEAGGRKAISNTVKDVKARAPGWIAQEITAVYNIKKGEITPSGSGKLKKMAGSINSAQARPSRSSRSSTRAGSDSRALRHDAKGTTGRKELHPEGRDPKGQQEGHRLDKEIPAPRAAPSRSGRTIYSWARATPKRIVQAGSHSSE